MSDDIDDNAYYLDFKRTQYYKKNSKTQVYSVEFNQWNSHLKRPREAILKIIENNKKAHKEVKFLRKANNIDDGIVKYYYSCVQGSDFYIFMEYCSKGSLGDLIKNKKSLNEYWPESELIEICYNLLSTLNKLHDKKIYHRDIKPDNIFVTSGDIYKIGDLGDCKDYPETLNTIKGTVYYMSPLLYNIFEKHSSTKDKINPKKEDIWSLGKTFVEMYLLEFLIDFKGFNSFKVRQHFSENAKQIGYSKDSVRVVLAMLEDTGVTLYSTEDFVEYFNCIKKGAGLCLKDDVKFEDKDEISETGYHGTLYKNTEEINYAYGTLYQEAASFGMSDLLESSHRKIFNNETSYGFENKTGSVQSFCEIRPNGEEYKSIGTYDQEISPDYQTNPNKILSETIPQPNSYITPEFSLNTNSAYKKIADIPEGYRNISDIPKTDSVNLLKQPKDSSKSDYNTESVYEIPFPVIKNLPDDQFEMISNPPVYYSIDSPYKNAQPSPENFSQPPKMPIVLNQVEVQNKACGLCCDLDTDIKLRCKHNYHKKCLDLVINDQIRLAKKFADVYCICCFRYIKVWEKETRDLSFFINNKDKILGFKVQHKTFKKNQKILNS
jgi:serine/threonine protein kinase